MSIYAVIPAAGVGKRFGAQLPKQYLPLCEKPILEWSLQTLINCVEIDQVWVALAEGDEYWHQIDEQTRSAVKLAKGGFERADSVRQALEQMVSETNIENDDWVLVHDAVRPLLRTEVVAQLRASLDQLQTEAGVILATPMSDTIKQVNSEGLITRTLDRTQLWAAQTPQIFRYGLLLDALERTAGDPAITDEASAMEACGYDVKVVLGQCDNIKITHPDDLKIAALLAKAKSIE